MAILCAVAMGGAAGAQVQEIPVELALHGARDAYRAGPVADRVVVAFTDDRGNRATERFIVRVDATLDSPIVALELGRLHVSATQGVLLAVHDDEATTFFEAPIADPVTPEALARVLPPLPVPQLELAFADEPSIRTAYTPEITWTEARLHEAARPPVITLGGGGAHGSVAARIDATTGRLRQVEAPLGPNATTMTLDIAPVEPGDPASWIVDRGMRRPVEHLGRLTRPPRDLVPGDAAPDIRALVLPSDSWSLHDALGAPSPHPIALVTFRAMPSGSHADQIARDVEMARDVVLDAFAALERADWALHGVAVVDLARIDLDRIAALESLWSAGVEAPGLAARLPWTSDATRAINAFDAEADALLVLVAPDTRIVAIHRLDGLSEVPDRVALEIREQIAGVESGERSEAPEADSVEGDDEEAPPP